MTYEMLLNRMLARVPDTIDKREGSLIYDALAPAAAEMTQMYMELERILRETFASTASREYLVRRAEERGLTPYRATKAIVKGEFNQDIPMGKRFTVDSLYYVVIEKVEGHVFKLECEQAGSGGNLHEGLLEPVEFINGLTKALITELIVPGEDEEETENFRKRYFATLDSQSFGGNIADYKEKVNGLPGIAGVKVYPAWDGGGTVKLIVINSDYAVPTQSLVDQIQENIDPVSMSGKGMGLAPIGHKVTVEGVLKEQIAIRTNITYQEGWSWTDIKDRVEEKIDGYFFELCKSWADTDNIIVRISQIENRLLDIVGIVDVMDTEINGSKKNYIVDPEKIPVRGVLHG